MRSSPPLFAARTTHSAMEPLLAGCGRDLAVLHAPHSDQSFVGTRIHSSSYFAGDQDIVPPRKQGRTTASDETRLVGENTPLAEAARGGREEESLCILLQSGVCTPSPQKEKSKRMTPNGEPSIIGRAYYIRTHRCGEDTDEHCLSLEPLKV